MYHISDLKKVNRCRRMYLLEQMEEKQPYQPFVRLDEEASLLAAEKLGAKEYFLGERNDPAERAMKALEEYEWLVKARFEYDRLRIKVPFLHKNGDGWDLYFMMIGLYPHADDMQFYCDTVWVLENLGLKIKSMRMVHLNGDYVRGKELDVDALFTVSDSFYSPSNNPSQDIEETVRKHMKDPTVTLDLLDSLSAANLPDPVRTRACTGRVRCRYYGQCFPSEKEVADNSIVLLSGAQHRFEMEKEGRLTLKDADPERVEGSRMQYAQILADENGGLFADVFALKAWLSRISYPIAFLDFEWERFAIPPYEGMKPYDVLPFEYSVHVMQEDGSMTHQVFLSVHDDRRDMAESLLRDIPETGSVIAYNADAAEKVRIEELARLFPEYREGLLHINERMEDLQLPFTLGAVYHTAMRGQWSLKSIMNIFDDAAYKELDINQGMEAVFQWRHLDASDESIDLKKIEEDLKAYCGMDSYAMTVVYQWLLELAGMKK